MQKKRTFFNSLNDKGVGLLELLISTAALLLIGAFGLKFYVDQNEVHNIQAEVSDMQQTVTFCLAEITKAVRNAGYQVPVGTPPYLIRIGTPGHDTLYIYQGTSFMKVYLDHTTEPAHPKLMVQQGASAAQVYAENIEDIDFIPVIRVGVTKINTLTVSITARTEKIDPHLADYRRRTVSSDIVMPNVL